MEFPLATTIYIYIPVQEGFFQPRYVLEVCFFPLRIEPGILFTTSKSALLCFQRSSEMDWGYICDPVDGDSPR